MIRTQLATAVLALATVCAAPSASAFFAVDVNASVNDYVNAGSGTWTYNYEVRNKSSCIMGCSGTILGQPINSVLAISQFSVPFFDDSSIANITSPTGWSYAVSAEDTFGLGAGAGTLTWSSQDAAHAIAIDSALEGFQYSSVYAPGKGPFQAVLLNGGSMIGDPAVPLSPHAIDAGLQPISPVPEPESAPMLLAGLGMVGAARARAARRAK